jgi:UDP-N-acetylglucosamine--N-acetylmuramyl-(pentapeptide) pyrophosphoryl-undecaprenol N-acetylglucosamine transferase
MRVIISGGGSGGHVFPAIAIADKLKERIPEAELLFVGAEGKMEMEKIPKAGYKIVGLPIRGLQRKLTLKNLAFPFRLIRSLWKARKVIKNFKPDVVIGVGGYASGPLMRIGTSVAAKKKGVKSLIQEQNSYPGITNKLLAKRVDKICVAYPQMDRFFPKEKIVLTGNPVREEILKPDESRKEGRNHFGLDPDKKTVLLFGGSLGARTLNEAMDKSVDQIRQRDDVQWIWQAGKLYIDKYKNSATALLPNVKIMAFIDNMGLAYKASDMAMTRAGALSIAELTLVGQATILIPSPNVAEDHQTKNAQSLVDGGAAVLLRDSEAKEKMVSEALALIDDENRLSQLRAGAEKMSKKGATEKIVEQIIKMCK